MKRDPDQRLFRIRLKCCILSPFAYYPLDIQLGINNLIVVTGLPLLGSSRFPQ